MSFRDQLLAYLRDSKVDHWLDPDGSLVDIFLGGTFTLTDLEIRSAVTFNFNDAGDLVGMRAE